MKELSDVLKHYGILGMKWGVRRDYTKRGGADGKLDGRGALGKRLDSLRREREWKSVLREMNTLPTKEITTLTKRLQLENSLKTLSRSKFGTKKDKEDYLRRGNMDNQELSRKVTRLRAKEGLYNAVSSASKEQREFGQKVVQVGGSLGIKYALTKSISLEDVYSTVKNPKSSFDNAKGDVTKVVLKKLKEQNGRR